MRWNDFVSGVRDTVPAIPPNVPFGMLFGATAVEVGFAPEQATAMSLFIFAGAAQMAAVELLRADAALPVVLSTVFILNLRYVVYSASLAGMVRDASSRWRAVMSYALFDINYALVTAKFRTDHDERESGVPEPSLHRGWYYLGVTLPLVGAFTVSTFLGALIGTSVGGALSLEFAIPLIFVALVVPMVENRTSLLVAVVAAVVAIVGAGLPFGSGLLVATGCGVVAGVLAKRADGPPLRAWFP